MDSITTPEIIVTAQRSPVYTYQHATVIPGFTYPAMYVDPSASAALRAEINALLLRYTTAGKAVAIAMNLLDMKSHIVRANKTVKDLTDTYPKEKTTGTGTNVHTGNGGKAQADKDFDDVVEPSTVKPNPTTPGGRIGKTPDGNTANVRGESTDGRPTLEIYNPNTRQTEIKIRY